MYGIRGQQLYSGAYPAGQNDDARLDRRDAILKAFTPSVDGNSYGYYRWGRSIDPETNTYVTTTSLNQGFSVSAGISLFDGFSAINNLKSPGRQLRWATRRSSRKETKSVLPQSRLISMSFITQIGRNPHGADGKRQKRSQIGGTSGRTRLERLC